MTTHRSRGTSIGHYIIEHELVRARGVVSYRAVHATLGRAVVLKVLDESSNLRGSDAAFVREAQVLDRLSHPNVARLYDCGTLADGRPWFACEQLVGPTLAEAIAAGSRIDAAYVLSQLAAVVAHAHAAGIAHRNLRAENVVCVVDPAGGIRLVVDGWTQTRDLAAMPTDAAADVHALGVIALQILGGVMAFSSGTLAMLTTMSAQTRFPRAARGLTALVDRMLARDVRLRPTAAQTRAAASTQVAMARRQAGFPVEADSEMTRIQHVA
jgi:serine/threonine-protein kinase|nr:protein kinase [Kofleriaceae bacterium]